MTQNPEPICEIYSSASKKVKKKIGSWNKGHLSVKLVTFFFYEQKIGTDLSNNDSKQHITILFVQPQKTCLSHRDEKVKWTEQHQTKPWNDEIENHDMHAFFTFYFFVLPAFVLKCSLITIFTLQMFFVFSDSQK